MVRLQHVSFRDWNPIGKPRKKPKEKSENLSESVKCGTSNTENLSKKTTSKSADPFGVAATLELTHSYVKDNNYILTRINRKSFAFPPRFDYN